MGKASYIGVSSKAHKIKKAYIGVGGKARKIKKAYIGVNGKARLWWTASEYYKLLVSKGYNSNDNGVTFTQSSRGSSNFLQGTCYNSNQGTFMDDKFVSAYLYTGAGDSGAYLYLSYLPKDSMSSVPTIVYDKSKVFNVSSTSWGGDTDNRRRNTFTEDENLLLIEGESSTRNYHAIEITSPSTYRDVGVLTAMNISTTILYPSTRLSNPIYFNGRWYFGATGSDYSTGNTVTRTFYATDLVNGTATLMGEYGIPVGFATSRGVLTRLEGNNWSYLLNGTSATRISGAPLPASSQYYTYGQGEVPRYQVIELSDGTIISVEKCHYSTQGFSGNYGGFVYLEPNSTTWKAIASYPNDFTSSHVEVIYLTRTDEKAFMVTRNYSETISLYYTINGKTYTQMSFGSPNNLSGLIYAHKGGYYHE